MRQLGQSIEVRSFDMSPHHRMAPGASQQGEKDKRQAVSQCIISSKLKAKDPIRSRFSLELSASRCEHFQNPHNT
jgi:hypothetical protein